MAVGSGRKSSSGSSRGNRLKIGVSTTPCQEPLLDWKSLFLDMHAQILADTSRNCWNRQYRVVQLNFTPKIGVFYMLFERSISIFSLTSLKQHIEYFHFRCEIQLDLPVHNKFRLHRWCEFSVSCVVSPRSHENPMGNMKIRDQWLFQLQHSVHVFEVFWDGHSWWQDIRPSCSFNSLY